MSFAYVEHEGRRRKLPMDLTGRRFGKLVVTGFAGYRGAAVVWECACDCGGAKMVETGQLRRGNVRSCGCLRYGPNCVLMRHGHCVGAREKSPSALWRKWAKVRRRKADCCRRWLRGSFNTFLNDVKRAAGEPPEGTWLVRRDTRRVWSPDNVVWMSPSAAARRRKWRAKR
jgi:hypothetical protein